MSAIPGILLSKTSGAFNQIQQELSNGALQGFSKQLESQFPQIVNNNGVGWNGGNPPPASQGQPGQPMAYYPPPSAYYGYGRPITSPQPAVITQVFPPFPGPVYAAPIGYINRGPVQTGPVLYPPYS